MWSRDEERVVLICPLAPSQNWNNLSPHEASEWGALSTLLSTVTHHYHFVPVASVSKSLRKFMSSLTGICRQEMLWKQNKWACIMGMVIRWICWSTKLHDCTIMAKWVNSLKSVGWVRKPSNWLLSSEIRFSERSLISSVSRLCKSSSIEFKSGPGQTTSTTSISYQV